MSELRPTVPLAEDEQLLQVFQADRPTYWRENAWMAAGAMAIGMAVLYFMGNPDVWTGAVGGLAAIAVRAFYLSSDELHVQWHLTNHRLLGPQARVARLGEIGKIRTLGGAVQIITTTGDKHLIKYQADRDDTIRKIKTAQAGGQP